MATPLSLSIAARCELVGERVCGLAPATPPQPSLAPPTHPHPALCMTQHGPGRWACPIAHPAAQFYWSRRGKGRRRARALVTRWAMGGGERAGGERHRAQGQVPLPPIRRAHRHRASALRRLAGEQAGFPPPQRARARLPGKPHPSCGNACRCSLPCARGHAPDHLAARRPRGRTLPDHPSTR